MNAKSKKNKDKQPASETVEPADVTDATETTEGDVETTDETAAVDNAFAELADGAEELPIEDELSKMTAERDDCFDKWKRAQAELENYRRRAQNEMQELRRYQAIPLARDLLPGLDNLERAIQASETSETVSDLAEGVRMVVKQFEDALVKHSILPIEAMERPFDPNLHEAVQQMPSPDHDPMTVIHEVQRGFVLHDRVVRPSKVIVSAAPPASESADTDAASDDVHTDDNTD
jgi:molecular chaperone GrpE